MDESIQVILIQVSCLSILFLIFLQAMILFLSSVKRQVQEKSKFDLESDFLQKKIEYQLIKNNITKQKVDSTWSGYRKFSIKKKLIERGSNACSFYLVPHDGKAIPGFLPGQHLFFSVNIPGHNKSLLRCYSISSSPSINSYYRISFKQALAPSHKPLAPAGLVSSYFYNYLKEGDILDVRAPSGRFFLDTQSRKPVVFIAGGIGVTPLVSMLDFICDEEMQRETWFFLSVKNKKNSFMQTHLIKMAARHENIHVVIFYSQADPEDDHGLDYDYAERVSVSLLKKHLPNNNFEFYVCGPRFMNESFKIDLGKWGVPEKSIHFEQFSQPETNANKISLNDERLKAVIFLANSNQLLEWDEAGDSILDLALNNGVSIDFSCKRGMCGLCQTTVISGEVFYDEPPEFLSDLEDGMCLPCVAKTKKRLELYA